MHDRELHQLIESSTKQLELNQKQSAILSKIFYGCKFRGVLAPSEFKELTELFPWFDSASREIIGGDINTQLLSDKINSNIFFDFWEKTIDYADN